MLVQRSTNIIKSHILGFISGLVFSSGLFALSNVYAQSSPYSPQDYAVPSNLSNLHFYLISVDVGDDVWDNFGHTALRVFDEDANLDRVFNWGTFDVSGGVISFSWEFFKGIMNYRLTTSTPSQEFSSYSAQGRTVWQDKINLTNPQKERLYQRLLWNLEPSHVEYDYQYFFDNCTTKVRDYLNEALDGNLSSQFQGLSQFSFRDHVQSHYQSVGLIGFSLDILMNGNIDRQISDWEEMFLPLKFREHLLAIESDVVENGERRMLLSDSQLIVQFTPPTSDTNAHKFVFYLLAVPVLFLFLMMKRIQQSYYVVRSQIGFRAPKLGYRLLSVLGGVTSLLSGIYGLLMLGGWFISDHTDTHHNINLLIFWPTDILGVIVALRWFFFCKAWPTNHNTAPFINYYLFAHLAAMFIYGIIAFLGVSQQQIADIALYVLPGFFMYTVLICIVGFEPAKPRNELI